MQDEMHRTKSVISEMLIELIDRSVNRIWKHLSGGDALRGCLLYTSGVGKTVFTQGLAKGLGIEEPVNSPTFTIVQVYEEGRLPLYHFDVYRIGDIEEMDEIGYEDYFYGEGVCLIEWARCV